MSGLSIPAAEFDVNVDLARRLLREQHPDLAVLPIRSAASGWDNVIFRLGDRLALRIPRRALGADLILHEQRWLPTLAEWLPLPIPSPVRVGVPSGDYPWHWSVTPWFAGQMAAMSVLANPEREARRLGEFMSALHRPAPLDAPTNLSRDTFIGDRPGAFAAGFERASGLLETNLPGGPQRVAERWESLIDVPRYAGPPCWLAGDVHGGNIVVDHGAIAAVIDFGDLCAGDSAVDLAIAWMLFDTEYRAVFRDAASGGPVPVDDAMWRRAEAWALHFGMLYLGHSADSELMQVMANQVLSALFGEF